MGGQQRLGLTYYRYESQIFNYGVHIVCYEYKVIKETPKGVWIANEYYDGDTWCWKKFILNNAKKQWACDSKAKALYSFIRRKERQISILTQQLDTAKQAAAKARDMLSIPIT